MIDILTSLGWEARTMIAFCVVYAILVAGMMAKAKQNEEDGQQ